MSQGRIRSGQVGRGWLGSGVPYLLPRVVPLPFPQERGSVTGLSDAALSPSPQSLVSLDPDPGKG